MALFIGRIPREMNNRDLEDTFSKYGKITRLDVKTGFGFVEFDDKRDAEDAIKEINEKGDLVVEWAKNNGKRPGENECFHCGKEGHWARDCQEAGAREGGGGGGYRGRRGGGRGGHRGGYNNGRDRSPRRGDGARNDRFDRRDFDRRRDDRGDRGGYNNDNNGRDRSPHRNEYRGGAGGGGAGFDRRGNVSDRRGDHGGGSDRDNNNNRLPSRSGEYYIRDDRNGRDILPQQQF